MTVRCVDCGMIMGAYEMLAHDCPAPGQVRLLGEYKEQTDAERDTTAPAAPEQYGPAEGEPAGPDPELQC